MSGKPASTGLFTVNEFAKLTRTTKDTLLHYDRIGLLSPASRRANNYRYYSSGQLAVLNVILTYQQLGMSLIDIKKILDHRNPDDVHEKLAGLIEQIDGRIEEWVRARKLLLTLRGAIRSVANIDENPITVQFMPAEAIVLGDLNDYSKSKTDYDALFEFYQTIRDKYPSMDLNYPVWGMFSEERMKAGDWQWPDRYYLYNPEGYDKRPAALYAIGYARGGYGQTDALYERIFAYIKKHGFEICGNGYEEYPLNEVCIPDNTNYLIRVMITVREKS